MIKVRIEGKEDSISQVIELLQESYEDIETTGIYEIERNRSRAYIDINEKM